MKIVRATPEPAEDLDVRLRRPEVTVFELATALHPSDTGAPPPPSLLVDGIAAPGDLTLEEAGVHDGSIVGDPAHATPLPQAVTGGLLDLVVVAGLDAGKRFALEPGSHVLGRGDDCDVRLVSPTVSRRQCRIDVDPAGTVHVHHLSRAVPTYVAGTAVDASATAMPGALVEVGAVALTVEWPRTDDAPANLDRFRSKAAALPLNRPPRFAPPPPLEPLVVPVAPDKANKAPFNFAALAAPVAMGVVMFVALHSVMYLMFTALSPVMMLGNWWETRHRSKRTLRKGTRTFNEQLEQFVVGLDHAAAHEQARLRTEHPHPGELVRRAVLPSVRLWERRSEHPDFLALAVGLGDVAWSPPLADRATTRDVPAAVADALGRHTALRQVPLVVDLDEGGVIGIVGPRAPALAVGRQLLCQAAVHHGPADLHIAVIAPSDGGKAWEWAKWLPHTVDLRPSPGEQRLLAGNPLEAAQLVEGLLADAPATGPAVNAFGTGEPSGPTTLFVVDGDELLVGRNSPTRQALRGAAGRAAGIVLAATADRLPAVCTSILTVDEWGLAELSEPRRSGDHTVALLAAGLSEHEARLVAASLGRFEDPEVKVVGGSLPDLVPLVDLLDLTDITAAGVEQRWRANQGFHLRAPIGAGERAEFVLDWDRHGPHGLVGGTTGSGKSELLKTLVAAFAATYSPQDLTFGLFDFKGGSTFTELGSLPHTVGMASDLDIHLARRALRCLRAELVQRERAFDQAGVKDLADYLTRRDAGAPELAGLPPIPRLIVIIDEFAAMASELAEEIGALTDLTARGRSLGVHLLLATQKPSTSVNAEIRTNTRLRISLQVEDAQDSADVIGIPDAASIRQKGRGFFRVGQGEIVPIQSALASGRTATENGPPVDVAPFVFGRSPRAEVTSPPREAPTGPNDLEALVAAIGAAHRESGAPDPRKPWPDPLPERLTLDELDTLRTPGVDPSADELSIALADDPEAQRRYPIAWPMNEGNLLLYGVTGSGTTTTLASLGVEFARTRSAARGHLYALDFGAGGLDALARLPHCGAVVGATDRERQIRLIRHLRAELDRRRDLPPSSRESEPRILLLVDNVEGFRAAYDDPEGAAELDRFARTFSDGPEVGIAVAATSTRVGGVPHTLAAATPHKWLFRLADPTDFSAFAISRKQVPTFVPGRFVLATNGMEAQVALSGDDLAGAVEEVALAASGQRGAPPQIQTLPSNVGHDEIRGASTIGADQWSLAVGRRDTDLGPATLRLYEHEHGLVAGPARSGRSTALLTLASSARDAAPSVSVLAVATRRSPLRDSPLVDAAATTADAIGALVDRALVGTGPTLVLIDDAETLDDPDGRFAQLLANAGSDLHVVVAGRNDVLRSLFGHWTQTVRRSKAGILIQPDADLDGDLLGARLPRKQHVAMALGRGYVISDALATLVQVAEPSAGVTTSE